MPLQLEISATIFLREREDLSLLQILVKLFFYKEPQDLYQTFCNAYAYYKQASQYNPTPHRQKLFQEYNIHGKPITVEYVDQIRHPHAEMRSLTHSSGRGHLSLQVANSNDAKDVMQLTLQVVIEWQNTHIQKCYYLGFIFQEH
ncbi:14534_t:CDS:2, partial [Racocetra fulgida]